MKPIIFSTPMVKAILEGRKTMTRRILKPQPDLGLDPFESYGHITVGNYSPALIDKNGEMYPGEEIFGAYTDDGEWGWKCPYGQVGDRLWVRETHVISAPPNSNVAVYYPADNQVRFLDPFNHKYSSEMSNGQTLYGGFKKKPSIHMPRWASRIILEITEVRVERLQKITADDAFHEGIERYDGVPNEFRDTYFIYKFEELWDSLNAKRGYGWSVNPWVWVIEFRMVDYD